MARFYFDVHDGEELPDLHGFELPDHAAARREAERLARELLREMPDRFAAGESWTIAVSNQVGALLFTLMIHLRQCDPDRSPCEAFDLQWSTIDRATGPAA